MASGSSLGLLFLHALPLDGSMWAAQADLLPQATYAPTLYGLGDTVEAWAASALRLAQEEQLIVVGCSIGGSCALEVAAIAPERVAALVLIGTKADRRLDLQQWASAIEMIEKLGIEAAWAAFWAPMFSRRANASVVDTARQAFLRQSTKDIIRGVTAFHSRPSRGDVLAAFAGSVTIVSGSEDVAPGLKVSAAQAAAARKGRLEIIPDCGHYVPLEQPSRLNSILRDVIAGQNREANN